MQIQHTFSSYGVKIAQAASVEKGQNPTQVQSSAILTNKALTPALRNYFMATTSFKGTEKLTPLKEQIRQDEIELTPTGLFSDEKIKTLLNADKFHQTPPINTIDPVELAQHVNKHDDWKKSVLYFIYPQSFKDSNGDGYGDIKGIEEQVPYIKSLGCTGVYFTPMYKTHFADGGYDVDNYREIDPRFGTMKDMDSLIKTMHDNKLSVIFDMVCNHTSDQHEWFNKASNPNDPEHAKYKDYYIWEEPKKGTSTPENPQGQPPNDCHSNFDSSPGSAWTYNKDMGKYYFHLYTPNQPELNWKNPEVRKGMHDNLKFWVNKGVDGFRFDVIDHIAITKPHINWDKQNFVNYPLLNAYYKEMGKVIRDLEKETGKTLITVGECGASSLAQDRVANNTLPDSLLKFAFNFEHLNHGGKTPTESLHNVLSGFMNLENLQKDKSWPALVDMTQDSSSQTRFLDTSTPELHDKSEKLLSLAMLTLKGTPFIYNGQEIGRTDPNFADISDYRDVATKIEYDRLIKEEGLDKDTAIRRIGKCSRDSARIPMAWNGDESTNGGFSDAVPLSKPWIPPHPEYKKLNIKSQLDDPNSILNFYKEMIKIRKNNEVLIFGEHKLLADKDGIFAYTQTMGKEKMLVVLNITPENKEFSHKIVDMTDSNLLVGNYGEDNKSMTLKPYEARLYKLSDKS
ncbi:MAG: alpha-amylase family glycosyl hydrolase [Candidatus Gastranaerophilaceae bacterium]|jgi:oligo-1,6-glucosidase